MRDQKVKPTVQTQINNLLLEKDTLEEVNNIKYGSVNIEIRDGIVYRIQAVTSILVKSRVKED